MKLYIRDEGRAGCCNFCTQPKLLYRNYSSFGCGQEGKRRTARFIRFYDHHDDLEALVHMDTSAWSLHSTHAVCAMSATENGSRLFATILVTI